DRLHQASDLHIKQQFIVLRDRSCMHRANADRMKSLKSFPDAFRPIENRSEDFAPVVALADDAFVITEVSIGNQRPLLTAVLLLRGPLLLPPLIIKPIG